jgi:jumonji domain-containing protein 2
MNVKGPIKQQIAGIGGVYEYALFDSPAMTLSEYRIKADEYRKGQLGHRASKDQDDKKEYLDDEACDDLARQFWRRLGPTTPPSIYGADMEGSLFDGDKASGWSLEGLDNCLQLLSAASCEGMPGVTTPYLYVGMWGSVFCA